MTIGIAAFGPWAGRAILEGLGVAERIAYGAIGGFVSFAVLCADGKLRRAEAQTGGSDGLNAVPEEMLAARVAALMSSAPNRPEPLAQFVAGAEGIGLVTGHRFPHMPGRSGMPLNQEVLIRMAKGEAPAVAVAAAVAENEDADAGLIAIAVDGRIASADTARLQRLRDRNSARLGSRGSGGLVAVRHNGIKPFRGLALIVADTTLARILAKPAQGRWTELSAGVPVVAAPADCIVVDDQERAVRLEVTGALGKGVRHIGMGSDIPVFSNNACIGFTLYEPFLVVHGGTLVSVDGQAKGRVPFASTDAGNGMHAGW
jgi:hypothetical protein